MKRQKNTARHRLALILSLLVLINWIALPGYGHDDPDHDRKLSLTIGSWNFTGSLNTARVGHTATLLANGKVLVAGGGSARSAELYDSVTKTWSATSDLNTPRAYHTATLLSNGKVLVIGGVDATTGVTNNSAEVYDPETGTWNYTARANIAHYGHTATRLQNGNVLAVGGLAAEVRLDSVEIYDPDTDTWSTTGRLNTARFLHTASLLPDGKVLVAGGVQDDVFLTGLGSTELFDPDTGMWSVARNLNVGRQQHTATLLPSGKVLIASGTLYYADFPYLTSSAELYDPAAGKWSKTGDLSASSERHTSTLLQNGGILIVGGYHADVDRRADRAELYDPDTGVWGNTGALNISRVGHTATLLPNGKVLVAGGFSSELNSAELYDPAAIVTPRILDASVSGKKLLLAGENFEYGAVILVNGTEKATLNNANSPRTSLIGKKAGKKIKPGDKVQVRTLDGALSEEFTFTG